QYPPIYFAGMAVIGFLQEFFQLTTFKTRAAGTDDLFDFLVDMSAATAVYLLFWTIYKIKDVWYDKK
ncbi:MAG: hypothetical protein GY943_28845, partial [Chloroflexi bacterium]|nr:hypothetical protein [Chloroflexota bacterium]